MRRWLPAAALTAAVLLPAPATTDAMPVQALAHRHWCVRVFPNAGVVRLIRRTYSGTRDVPRRARRRIAGREACLRDPARRGHVLAVNRRARRAWQARRDPWHSGFASQYDDSGATSSGWHAAYGVAVCGSGGGPCFAFGTRIEFAYGGRDVVATVDDHGPYVSGRDFDLADSTAGALGFSGLGTVRWRVVR